MLTEAQSQLFDTSVESVVDDKVGVANLVWNGFLRGHFSCFLHSEDFISRP